MAERINVSFFDGVGDGINRDLEVNSGITLHSFLNVHSSVQENAIYRVNGQEASMETVLQDGDRVAASATNIKGA